MDGCDPAISNAAWEPPLSFEEHLKRIFIPKRLHLIYRVRKEFRRGERELGLVPFLCDPERVAVDAGANQGVWAEVMRRHARAVHAFEPNPKMFRLLKAAAGPTVQAHPIALSNSNGVAELRIPKKARGYSNQGGTLSLEKIGTEPYGRVQVETRRLDDLDLGDIGFLKIDVEGHELAVLDGARQVLARCRPTLVVEMEEKHAKRPIGELLSEVSAYGYRAFALDKGVLRPVSAIDLAMKHSRVLARGTYIFNWIFLPV